MALVNTSTILSHKRERSLGFMNFSDDEEQLRNPASMSISSMDELLPPDNDYAESQTAIEGRITSGEEEKLSCVKLLDEDGIESGTGQHAAFDASPDRQSFFPRGMVRGTVDGAPLSYNETPSLLTPQSATFSIFSSSDAFAEDNEPEEPSSRPFSTSPPSPFLQQHPTLSSSYPGHDSMSLYPGGGEQPPSLSPMTISTPSFSFDQAQSFRPGGHASDGTPITPISPFNFQQGGQPSDTHSQSQSPPPYAPSQRSDSPSTVYTDSDSTYAPYAPAVVRRAPTTRLASGASTSRAAPFYQDEEEHPRARMKRTHSDKRDTMDSNELYAQARLIAQQEAAFIGPQSEIDAAASAAAAAAAKTGAGAGAFVYKVYHMLLEKDSQDLISFTPDGTCFVVTNTVAFSKDVLPKHFKHSNFSSFVRQLNMYGFHKVNKTPRGQARNAETQAWEFTHPKFVRGKPHQLDEIKRKPSDGDTIMSQKPRHSFDGPRSADGAIPSFPPIIFAPTPKRPSSLNTDAGPSQTLPTHPGFPAPPRVVPHAHSQIYGIPSQSKPSHQYQSYPSPQSVQQSPQHPFQPPNTLAQSHPQSNFRPPPPPSVQPPSFDGRTGFAPQPMPSRVDLLEQQKMELSAALSGTQEGYDALYRDFTETRRRQDQLIDLVTDMHSLLNRTGNLQHLPYPFPSHLFAPGTFDENPLISVTSAQFSRHLQTTEPHPDDDQYTESYDSIVSPYDASSPYDTSTADHFHRSLGSSPAIPSSSFLGQSAGPGNRQGGLVVDTGLAGAIRSSSRAHSATLAPPVNTSSSFGNAINTPLPASPLHGGHREAVQGLVGLGLGTQEEMGMSMGSSSAYYTNGIGGEGHGDIEMSSSSLSGYADGNVGSYHSHTLGNSRSSSSIGSRPRSGARGPPSPYASSRASSSRRASKSSSFTEYNDSFIKREEDVAAILSGTGSQSLRLSIP